MAAQIAQAHQQHFHGAHHAAPAPAIMDAADADNLPALLTVDINSMIIGEAAFEAGTMSVTEQGLHLIGIDASTAMTSPLFVGYHRIVVMKRIRSPEVDATRFACISVIISGAEDFAEWFAQNAIEHQFSQLETVTIAIEVPKEHMPPLINLIRPMVDECSMLRSVSAASMRMSVADHQPLVAEVESQRPPMIVPPAVPEPAEEHAGQQEPCEQDPTPGMSSGINDDNADAPSFTPPFAHAAPPPETPPQQRAAERKKPKQVVEHAAAAAQASRKEAADTPKKKAPLPSSKSKTAVLAAAGEAPKQQPKRSGLLAQACQLASQRQGAAAVNVKAAMAPAPAVVPDATGSPLLGDILFGSARKKKMAAAVKKLPEEVISPVAEPHSSPAAAAASPEELTRHSSTPPPPQFDFGDLDFVGDAAAGAGDAAAAIDDGAAFTSRNQKKGGKGAGRNKAAGATATKKAAASSRRSAAPSTKQKPTAAPTKALPQVKAQPEAAEQQQPLPIITNSNPQPAQPVQVARAPSIPKTTGAKAKKSLRAIVEQAEANMPAASTTTTAPSVAPPMPAGVPHGASTARGLSMMGMAAVEGLDAVGGGLDGAQIAAMLTSGGGLSTDSDLSAVLFRSLQLIEQRKQMDLVQRQAAATVAQTVGQLIKGCSEATTARTTEPLNHVVGQLSALRDAIRHVLTEAETAATSVATAFAGIRQQLTQTLADTTTAADALSAAAAEVKRGNEADANEALSLLSERFPP